MIDCDLIIKGRHILTMDDKNTIINDGFIAVLDGRILDIGQLPGQSDKYTARATLDASNSIVMPGLINTHTHAGMTLFRGLADDLPLDEWLNGHIWPAEAKYVDRGFVSAGTRLACLEMIKSGITRFNDMYFFSAASAEAIIGCQMRALIGEPIIGFSTPGSRTPDDAINDTISLGKEYAGSEFIYPAFNPHSIYTCTRQVLEQVSILSRQHNIPVHIHLCETKKEVDDCINEYGKTPIAYLDGFDFFSAGTIAAHSVWLDEDDIRIYMERGIRVSHNPASNMKLASGVAPVGELRALGVAVGLGTDGAASNNTLELFSEMKTCSILHKVMKNDPALLGAVDIVRMATIEGARVLGLNDRIGSLEIDKFADMITIGLDKPHLAPLHHPYSHLVYSANAADVDDVVINGKILMRKRKLLDMDEGRILAEAEKYSGKFY